MSTKHVILANGSRLLREMLHHVINQAGSLEVLQEVPDREALPAALRRFEPEWVILSPPLNNDEYNWIKAVVAQHPSIRFMFLSPERGGITIKGHGSQDEDLPNPSLKDFLQLLERDLQHS
jgi:DNA-binding NarL/FixJ family response regulator